MPDNDKTTPKHYRALSDLEIDCINQVTDAGADLANMIKGLDNIMSDDNHPLMIDERSLNIGVTHLQTGLMWIRRAIAKPEAF